MKTVQLKGEQIWQQNQQFKITGTDDESAIAQRDADSAREQAERTVIAWQQLARHLEERSRLIRAAVSFYKTADEVGLFPRFTTLILINH